MRYQVLLWKNKKIEIDAGFQVFLPNKMNYMVIKLSFQFNNSTFSRILLYCFKYLIMIITKLLSLQVTTQPSQLMRSNTDCITAKE